MPELPEVETIRRGLARRVTAKKIAEVKIGKKKKVVKDSAVKFKQVLVGQKFGKILRRGKLLALSLTSDRAGDSRYLLIHLKMTGQLIYRDGEKLVAGGHPTPLGDKYTHVTFNFTDGSQLFFNDMRQFGYLRIVNEEERRMIWQTFGIEPVERGWNWQVLRDILRKRKALVKAILLDQAVVAGLGNIYVDEALWRAKVRPDRAADSLSDEEIKRIAKAAREVLKKAIEVGGTTFSDYRKIEGTHGKFTKYLRVYDKAGQRCKRCKNLIEKTRVAGRGTHYCRVCQV